MTEGVCDAILYGSDRCRVMPRTGFSIWGVSRSFPGWGRQGGTGYVEGLGRGTRSLALDSGGKSVLIIQGEASDRQTDT